MATCSLFVYGTLKPGERAFKRLCQPYVVTMQDAIAPGRLYHLPVGYPALTLEAGWVRGVLLTLASASVLSALDAFEDYDPQKPETSEYQRQQHPIYTPNHSSLGSAWVYVMSQARVVSLQGQWLPEGYWSEAHSLNVQPTGSNTGEQVVDELTKRLDSIPSLDAQENIGQQL